MTPAGWLLASVLAQLAPEPLQPAAATAAALEQSFLEEQRALLAGEKEKGRVAKNLAALSEEKRDTLARIEALEAEQAELAARIEAIRARQAELRARREVQQKAAGERLALLARRSAARPLELLLTASSPGEFVYRYHALRAIAAAERELLASAKRAADELAAAELVLDQELEVSQSVAWTLAGEAQRLEALETLQREQFAALEQEVEERRLWMQALAERAQALGVMTMQLQSGRKERAKPATGGPVAGVRVAAYGDSDPRTGNLLPSDGWSFQADAGTPVVAVAAGTVVYADWFQGYGFLVIVDHGGGYSSLYAHLGSTAVEKGAPVAAGDEVGTAGASGSVTEPGLYFEVRQNGRPIDPAAWLKGR